MSWAILATVLSLCFVALLGLGILFSRASHVERPALVGLLTLAGVLIGATYFWGVWRVGGPSNWWQVVGAVLIGCVTYALGRFLDYSLGPVETTIEENEATYGAELAD